MNWRRLVSVWGMALALASGILVLGLRTGSFRKRPTAVESTKTPSPAVSPVGVPAGSKVVSGSATDSESPAWPHWLTTPDQRWQSVPKEPEFAAFTLWARDYLEGSTRDGEHGLQRARERRPKMEQMMVRDPKRALELAIPSTVREMLPDAIRGELEQWVEGRGDLMVLASLPEPGREPEVRPVFRELSLRGQTWDAHVYGRRLDEPSRTDIGLQAITLGDLAAVSEDPIWRTSAFVPVDAICSVSGALAAAGPTPMALGDGADGATVCSPVHADLLHQDRVLAEAGGSGQSSDGTPRLDSVKTEGMKRLILIRVDFRDLVGAPFSDSRGSNMVKSLHQFYSDSSYGRSGFHPVGGGSVVTATLRLPKTAAVYGSAGSSSLRTDARAAARAAGHRLEDFDYDVYCFGSVPGFGWAGLGYVGAPGSWVRNSFDEAAGVMAHELGHNYGLNHANFWDTGGESIMGRGESVEYGDSFDTMGNASAGRRHFNARYKNLLNWLPNDGVAVFSTNGLYRIAAHDDAGATGSRAFRIARDSRTNYWVEFRQRFTALPAMMDGVTLRWGRSGNQATLLLDTTPGSAGNKNDAALTLGRTFSDPAANIHITPIRKSDSSPVTMDLMVFKGEFTNNVSPNLTVVATTTNAALRQEVVFIADAVDPNGDELAYAWNFGDETFGGNQARITKSWTTAGHYFVRCTATDMKGGQTTAAILVTVGQPTRFRISGTVREGGAPVANARVYVSNTQSVLTDQTGTYVLTGISAGSYTLKASMDGRLFTRVGFDNPLQVRNNLGGVDFLARRQSDLALANLVPAGAEWYYQDEGLPASADWKSIQWDHSLWKRGAARLGYGDDNVVTSISFGGVSSNKRTTYYFRRKFEVQDPSAIQLLTLGLIRDDGAAVYLNGREIVRENLPSGTLLSTTFAESSVGGADESTFYETELDPGLLQRGTNLIAVEVHQHSRDSSDLHFDLRLTALLGSAVIRPVFLAAENSAEGVRISWSAADDVELQSTTDLHFPFSWVPTPETAVVVGDRKEVMIPPASPGRLFRLFPAGSADRVGGERTSPRVQEGR